jgi:hypothetical protein
MTQIECASCLTLFPEPNISRPLNSYRAMCPDCVSMGIRREGWWFCNEAPKTGTYFGEGSDMAKSLAKGAYCLQCGERHR